METNRDPQIQGEIRREEGEREELGYKKRNAQGKEALLKRKKPQGGKAGSVIARHGTCGRRRG